MFKTGKSPLNRVKMLGAQISVLIGLLAVSQSQNIETRSVAAYPKQQSGGLGPLFASFGGGGGFRDNSYEDNAVTPTPVYRGQQQQPQQQPIRIGSPQQQQQKQRVLLVRGQQHHHLTKNGQPIKYKPGEESLEEQLEREEPDRLSLLLPQSRFDCVGKQTGYYADEELNCEVFHYCQDNARHSWICPEGFTFHQVHLICMPPNSPAEITCKKSSQYHFVNEYLYKPLNLQEAESRPNVTLRYSERYFPADIYTDERADRSDEYSASSSVRVHQQPRRPPVRLLTNIFSYFSIYLIK